MFSICIKRAYEIDSRLPSMTFQVNKICLKFQKVKPFHFSWVNILFVFTEGKLCQIYLYYLHAHFILQSPCFNNYAAQVPFEGRGGGGGRGS